MTTNYKVGASGPVGAIRTVTDPVTVLPPAPPPFKRRAQWQWRQRWRLLGCSSSGSSSGCTVGLSCSCVMLMSCCLVGCCLQQQWLGRSGRSSRGGGGGGCYCSSCLLMYPNPSRVGRDVINISVLLPVQSYYEQYTIRSRRRRRRHCRC